MKKMFFTLLVLPVLSFAQVNEQTRNDIQKGEIQLQFNKSKVFIKDNKEYKLSQYNEVFSNEVSINHIKKARTNKTFASILSYAGGFGIGFGVAYALTTKSEDEYTFSKHDRKTGWTIAGVGAGLALSSIPLWNGYKKNVEKAVDVENSKQTISSEFRMNLNGNGVGLVYKF